MLITFPALLDSDDGVTTRQTQPHHLRHHHHASAVRERDVSAPCGLYSTTFECPMAARRSMMCAHCRPTDAQLLISLFKVGCTETKPTNVELLSAWACLGQRPTSSLPAPDCKSQAESGGNLHGDQGVVCQCMLTSTRQHLAGEAMHVNAGERVHMSAAEARSNLRALSERGIVLAWHVARADGATPSSMACFSALLGLPWTKLPCKASPTPHIMEPLTSDLG